MSSGVDIFRMVRNRIAENLRQLNQAVPDEDLARLTGAVLADLEQSGWRLVPVHPTREMVQASLDAMNNRRFGEGWVGARRKHAWRLIAAIAAAPRPVRG